MKMCQCLWRRLWNDWGGVKSVRIIFKKPCEADIEEFEVRALRDGEVLVKVYYTLISAGTEKAYFSGSPNTAHRFPTVPGYSSVGIVESVGQGVTEFKKGDRVFVAAGGHAGYNIQTCRNIVRIPDNVSFQEAVFTRVASFPLLAIRRAELEIGESVVIVGLGMLGLFGVQIAHLAGACPVIGIGNREIRQKKAKSYGAEMVLSPDDANLEKKILDFTYQKTGIKGANVVIETSGTESGLISSVKYTSSFARVMINGCNRVMTQPIDFYRYVHMRGVSLIGAHDHTRKAYNSAHGNWTAKRDYITLLNLMSYGRIDAQDMVGEIVSPNEATETYERLLNDREFPLGVLFDFEHFSY